MKRAALLMWLGIVTTAAAQTEHEEMIFRGVGAVTCGEFARQYSIRPDFALVVVPEEAGAVRTAPRHVHLDRSSLMRLRTESLTLQRGY